jgi:hypothetical protein
MLADPTLQAMGRVRIEDRRGLPPDQLLPGEWDWSKRREYDELWKKQQDENWERRLREDKKPRVFE